MKRATTAREARWHFQEMVEGRYRLPHRALDVGESRDHVQSMRGAHIAGQGEGQVLTY